MLITNQTNSFGSQSTKSTSQGSGDMKQKYPNLFKAPKVLELSKQNSSITNGSKPKMYKPLAYQRQMSLYNNKSENSYKGYHRSNTSNYNRMASPLSSQENQQPKRQTSNSPRTEHQNPTLNALLQGRKKIVFLTKVLISTLEITQNEFTPVLSFLLTKYMKKVIDTLKARHNFVIS